MTIDLGGLQTEQRNPATINIDKVSTVELCQIINNEDAKVATAVAECVADIARAIDSLVRRVRQGGRVIYVGAGTSGRLGVLDASELPPTFTANPEQFVALIAGGDEALRYAQEGAEDDLDAAVADLKALKLNGKDSLIGIAASGRTPYVLSCLTHAHALGCCTIGVACSHPSTMSRSGYVDHMISAITGPEVVTGSTRLKAGTATKMILNMLSTGTMIQIGKTFGNVMIDVKATNLKLKQRSRNILRAVCGEQCPKDDAELDYLLRQSNGSVKLAATSLLLSCSVSKAQKRLVSARGVLSELVRPTIPVEGVNTGCLHLGDVSKPRYVLCVDGGGSKCCAVLSDTNGRSAPGVSGPCNPTDIGLDGAISSIETAIQMAAGAFPELEKRSISTIPVSQVWIGLAGWDRPTISIPMTSALEKLFEQSLGSKFRITTDLEMLVTVAARRSSAQEVVALIAGTGSSAMKFSRSGDRYVRTNRSGGWGYLLGDDGSGFDLGRQALRHCLAALDQERNGEKPICMSEFTCYLCQRMRQYFAPDQAQDQTYDLLSAVIASNGEAEVGSVSNTKKRIAAVARIVVELIDIDPNATAIVDRAVESLVELLRPLIRSAVKESSRPLLVLAGGLMQSVVFRSKLKSRILDLQEHPISSQDIVCVQDPAAAAANYLISEEAE